MAHSTAIGTEYEIAGEAVLALSASDRGCSETGRSFSQSNGRNILAHLDYSPGEFMPKNDRRVISKCVVPDMNIGSANATIADLEFNLIIAAYRLFYIDNPDVTLSGRIFNDSFH
jgi:hypothetical protein